MRVCRELALFPLRARHRKGCFFVTEELNIGLLRLPSWKCALVLVERSRLYGWHSARRTTKQYCTYDDNDFIFIILGVMATFWQSVIDEPGASAYNRSKDGIDVKKIL
jgi:hypothetical protein